MESFEQHLLLKVSTNESGRNGYNQLMTFKEQLCDLVKSNRDLEFSLSYHLENDLTNSLWRDMDTISPTASSSSASDITDVTEAEYDLPGTGTPVTAPLSVSASSGVPVVAASSGVPVVAASSGVPVVAASSGVPVVAASSGVPVVASSTGVPVVAMSYVPVSATTSITTSNVASPRPVSRSGVAMKRPAEGSRGDEKSPRLFGPEHDAGALLEGDVNVGVCYNMMENWNVINLLPKKLARGTKVAVFTNQLTMSFCSPQIKEKMASYGQTLQVVYCNTSTTASEVNKEMVVKVAGVMREKQENFTLVMIGAEEEIDYLRATHPGGRVIVIRPRGKSEQEMKAALDFLEE